MTKPLQQSNNFMPKNWNFAKVNVWWQKQFLLKSFMISWRKCDKTKGLFLEQKVAKLAKYEIISKNSSNFKVLQEKCDFKTSFGKFYNSVLCKELWFLQDFRFYDNDDSW